MVVEQDEASTALKKELVRKLLLHKSQPSAESRDMLPPLHMTDVKLMFSAAGIHRRAVEGAGGSAMDKPAADTAVTGACRPD
jgi:hypothetical protein